MALKSALKSESWQSGRVAIGIGTYKNVRWPFPNVRVYQISKSARE